MISSGNQTYLPLIDVYEGVDLTIGNYCSIGSGLKIYSGTHACIEHPEVVSTFAFNEVMGLTYPAGKMGGFVAIGHDVWIATDVKILEGVTIGSGAIIGAGSLVTKDVPPFAVVGGVPGKILRYRFSKEQIKKLMEIRWWDWLEEDVKERVPNMKNIDEFIAYYNLP